jgi:23S rRNA (cytidine1920-2'-O)/16S rRNA (cytidine1409-2'-O)-methyltransferase
MKQRLDILLVERGLCDTRAQAQRLIAAGQVRVGGQVAGKPGHLYAAETELTVASGERFVSRGGLKLEAALQAFPVTVAGTAALDVGASTGGFTDCLLQRGARRIYAVDVGKGQLHWKLRRDPRVVVMEGLNARHLAPAQFPEPIRLAVVDVSFISLTLILPPVTHILQQGGDILTLVKPQFEAGRDQVGRGGVVRDETVRRAVLERIRRFGEETLGLEWRGQMVSPLKGPAGNIEFLAWWFKP